MRARNTTNFTLKQLPEVVKTCQQHGVECYVTLNSVLYDHDLRLMRNIVDACCRQKVDAIIAGDWAVIRYAALVDMPVHISTQLNVSNIEAVKFFSTYADTIILARELDLRLIRKITRQIDRQQITGPSGHPVKVEVFVHGALCVAVSGRCYWSLHSHNASANRGACYQNCRRQYHIKDSERGHEWRVDNGYIFSPKDLCTIEFLDQIIESSASVLKIEGRGRSPEYVKTVTHCYRAAIDGYLESKFSQKKKEEWKLQLKGVFNRGFWEGYYLGKRTPEHTNGGGSKATRGKTLIGTCVKYFRKPRVAEFRVESFALRQQDHILITGPTTGVYEERVSELRVDDRPVRKAKKGDHITIPVSERVRPNDKLFKII